MVSLLSSLSVINCVFLLEGPFLLKKTCILLVLPMKNAEHETKNDCVKLRSLKRKTTVRCIVESTE